MRKLLQSSMLFVFAFSVAQNVSDYQYVSIPQKFKDFDENKFGLNTLLIEKLKAKKYTVINGSNVNLPADAQTNLCNILRAEVSNTSSFLKNRVQVEFKDCNQKTVGTFEGKSNIKDFEAGYRNALEIALNNLQPSNPVAQNMAVISESTETKVSKETQIVATPNVTPDDTKKEVVFQTASSKSENKAQTYSNGTVNLNRIEISEGQFILADPESPTPYAIFRASTKKDVYRVQLQNGIQTFGYLEDGKIVIETTNADGSAGKEVFSRK